MFQRFAPILFLGLASLAPLCAQDNGYFFNAAVRATISRSPFYPDIYFYGALPRKLHDFMLQGRQFAWHWVRREFA